jgi:hypothetical protein
MPTVLDLLAKGYFPEELPPPFSTKHFASCALSDPNTPVKEFQSTASVSRLCPHSLPRFGRLRRKLGIPNPTAYVRLSSAIVRFWPQIRRKIAASPFSKSTSCWPRGSERAISPAFGYKDLAGIRADVRANARYLVRTDISQCYHSIYTHSIPWALHTKAVAKKKQKDQNLAGNVIDSALRSGQDKQTVGIPIGPDSSLLLAELVLSSLDSQFTRRIAKRTVSGFRYVDDYEFCCLTLADAEEVLALLEGTLAEFELTLNPKKTFIQDLPQPIDSSWAHELRQFTIRVAERAQHTDLVGYFDKVFDLSRVFPDENVVKYGVARLRSTQLSQSNFPLFQKLLAQAAMTASSTVSEVVVQLLERRAAGLEPNVGALEELLNRVIVVHAPLGHGNEVAWCLWAAMVFGTRIRTEAASAVAGMDDSVVGILALDAETRGLVDGGSSLGLVAGRLTSDDLLGENWLLAYEANVHGWCRGSSGPDYVNSVPTFRFLKKAGVRFYQPSLVTPTVLPPRPARVSIGY